VEKAGPAPVYGIAGAGDPLLLRPLPFGSYCRTKAGIVYFEVASRALGITQPVGGAER